jgi:hypothetical protein
MLQRTAGRRCVYNPRVSGPQPFSQNEIQILEAAQLYSFESLGRNEDGKLLVKVHNGSNLCLKYLSVGVKVPRRSLFGATRLDVSQIKPGETKIFECDCYRSLAFGYETELFRRPPPIPEERRMYWELRSLPDGQKPTEVS